MSEKGMSRRKFLGDVAKYCGAGVAAITAINAGRAHASDQLEVPAHEGMWRMRDAGGMQSAEWRRLGFVPQDWFEKKPEQLINDGKPVEWSHLHANYYAEGSKSLVGLIMATPVDKDLKGDIKKAMKLIGGFEKSLKKSDRILIKANLNSAHPYPGGGSDGEFLQALILVLKDEGYENLTVADSTGPWAPIDRVSRVLGIDTACSTTKTPLLEFEKSKWMNIRNANAEYLGKFGGKDGTVAYPEMLRNFDKIIYTPVMKTHYLGGITMSLKLTVGLMHRADRANQLHTFNNFFVAPAAAEINLPLRPDLIIMDGRRSFISGGPSHGEQVRPGVVLASGDQVACDVTGIKLLQEYYPNMAANKITTYAWYQKQILQAVKVGVGYAKKDEDVKVILG
ncbi:MAG TPA: DUF362 domain-containing protein [Thermodesulfobacteriota bacterium]|nr:DUF362 domain-containing protein [Thermodesulfobacteriota bacterium]